MTYSVVWADQALAAAQTYLVGDRLGLMTVFDATDQLATQPRPNAAFAWGIDRYRMHIGRYRVIYEITEGTVTVEVLNPGRGRRPRYS